MNTRDMTSSINTLLQKMPKSRLECGIVVCFIKQHNIHTRNVLLQNIIQTARISDVRVIYEWMTNNNIMLDLNMVERIFELSIDTRKRKLTGAYHTPKFIIDNILKKTITRTTYTICDCACGSGAFLVEAARRLSKYHGITISDVIENSIYGVDKIHKKIEQAKILLTLLMLTHGEDRQKLSFNLKVADSLNVNWAKLFPEVGHEGFDAIVGNPPYVRARNLPDYTKRALRDARWKTAPSGKPDLFMPFVELGAELINENGTLGYILPNTFYTSLAARGMRNMLQERTLIKEMIDFGHQQAFDDVTTYTCILVLDKRPKDVFYYTLIEDPNRLYRLNTLKKSDYARISFSELNPKKWILLRSEDMKNIVKIETAGLSLNKICDIRTGISTMRNHLYTFTSGTCRNGCYTLEYNNKKYRIEKGITKEVLKSGQIKDVGHIRDNRMRIIFPYLKNKNGMMIPITESHLKKNYPHCYQYFRAIRPELEKRDKGKKEYDQWYAYGRSQGLENHRGEKLIMADIGNKPNFVICTKKGVAFFTGYGLWLNKKTNITLSILQKILNSKVFEYYIGKTSRRYREGYRSYAKHFVETFSIPEFTDVEIRLLKRMPNVDQFLTKKYKIRI